MLVITVKFVYRSKTFSTIVDLIDHLNSQLITVLVMDDFNEGIPVAWMITNNEWTDSLRVFFQSLRERCGYVITQFSMSDDADSYHNTWCSAFSRPDRKLLCSWHVNRSWRRKLNEYFKDKEQQADVYAPLKNLQNETTGNAFRRSLQRFLAWLKGICPQMASYFEKECASWPREWGSCFREGFCKQTCFWKWASTELLRRTTWRGNKTSVSIIYYRPFARSRETRLTNSW